MMNIITETENRLHSICKQFVIRLGAVSVQFTPSHQFEYILDVTNSGDPFQVFGNAYSVSCSD